MIKVKSVPGVMWASDILTGRRPIPTNKTKKLDPTFQKILDEEIAKLDKEVMAETNTQ